MERVWWSRLRWRMRGAWLWPAFVGFTVADGILLAELPFAGDGTGLVAGALLAGFLNLIAIAVVAPFGGRLLRRRRPDLPKDVASDYAGTVLIAAVAALLLAGGLLHRPAVAERERDAREQLGAAQRFIAHSGPPGVRRNAALADSLRLDDDLYRTCVPAAQPNRAFCVYVDTGQSPPGVRVDPNRAPNSKYAPVAER